MIVTFNDDLTLKIYMRKATIKRQKLTWFWPRWTCGRPGSVPLFCSSPGRRSHCQQCLWRESPVLMPVPCLNSHHIYTATKYKLLGFVNQVFITHQNAVRLEWVWVRMQPRQNAARSECSQVWVHPRLHIPRSKCAQVWKQPGQNVSYWSLVINQFKPFSATINDFRETWYGTSYISLYCFHPSLTGLCRKHYSYDQLLAGMKEWACPMFSLWN